jgi:response regulator of citrate/malate metabolism
MKVLIVEDEPLSAEHLIRTLNKVDKNIQVIKTLDSISNTVKFLSQEFELDLIFLDIHIADGNSFEIFSFSIKPEILNFINIIVRIINLHHFFLKASIILN